ncbi:hypothetical protein [Flagellimonas beolgyonensis]|uniref:hypothetical protein n=1 Tax=Flagellimonas beolgyonensis TaxID=864064 RepID=UPI000F8D8CA6|nr:hypothetical protein [Allomuricauda beolgyonensis]
MKLDNKNKMLLLGLVALLFLSYHLAIKKTLSLRADYLGNLENQELSKNIPLEIAKLNQKEKYLDAQFMKLNLSSSAFQTDLLKFLNENNTTQSVKLIEFKSPHFFQDKSTENVTYMMKLEGRYTEILKVLYALENQSGFGSISHTSFEKQNNHRTQKEHLQSSVFLKLVY